MDVEKLKCVVELGNTKIICVVAQMMDDSSIKILSTVKTESKGIHNGVIVNLQEATKAIRSCLSNAETEANVTLKKINVVLEIPEFICTRLSKYRKVNGSKIQKDDISFLLKEAKKEVNLNDNKKSIIHIFNHNYIVDKKKVDKEPIGIYADYLSHEMTFITIPKNIIKNLNQVFIDCDLEIERFISSTFASAVNYLSDTDFQLGATLIDIGFEKTSLGVFNNYALIHSMTFPIGINHVTKDISRGCSLSLKESEDIRNQIGCFFWKDNVPSNEEKNLSEKFFKESKFRKISKLLVSEIITARIEEIMEIIKKEIYTMGFNLTSGQNIFITGGGSNLPYLNKICATFFPTNIKILNSLQKNHNSTQIKENTFDPCNGALKIIFNGWETEAIPSNVEKNNKNHGFFFKILGNSP